MSALPQAGKPGDLESLLVTLSQLPPEHFKLALKAVEAELARSHELRLEQERSRIREAADARTHALFAWGLGAGFVVVLGMIAASVVIGLKGYVWLSASLSGPGVVVLASLFVLRKLDSSYVRHNSDPQLSGSPSDQTPVAAS
jgi:hypothetical protein